MADEATIIFNYKKAMGQADDLMSVAKEVRKVADNSLADSIKTIDKNWDGDNSVKFINKGNKLKDKIADSANDIERVAGAIKSMAKTIYDGEMTALRIARERAAAAAKSKSK